MENKKNLSQLIHLYIDHTLLNPDASPQDIDRLCAEARKYRFAAVSVNAHHIRRCAELLQGYPSAVNCAVGFPLGATTSLVKSMEAAGAIAAGATEIDMVINIGELKADNDDFVEADIRAVVEAARSAARSKVVIIKVIIETGLLSNAEKVRACHAARRAGADFVKTSTGFATGGATEDDIRLMGLAVENALSVKAAGGIRTWEAAQKMIAAGAKRIGTTSGVAIVEEALNFTNESGF
jgi:deoxyribose-phosphate aldolase